ncbi:MAG: winged helix-turn-helix domain-containing protein [Nitrosotalea sp.]
MVKKTISKNKALQSGPLESVFPGSTSKILDFLATFKDWDYSVSDIAKNSGVSFKTALNEIKNLEQQGVVSRTRTVGKATMYKLNLDSKQGFYIDRLIFEIATKRALGTKKENKTTKITV